MLEGPSFLVARDLPSACEQESKWIYSTYHVIELSKGKRRLEDAEEIGSTKSYKPLDPVEKEDFISSQRSHNQGTEGDRTGSGSLIGQIGKDLSISCLIRCSRADYGSIASLNRDFRSLIRSGELYRLRRLMGITEHWVYFSCSLLEWKAFDPIHRRWMHLPTMMSNDCFMCSDKESLAVGTELLVFGKEILSFVTYKYSILTNSWSPGVKTNTPRCLFGSASLGEIAIVAGGCDSQGNILSSAELYNSETGTWVILPSMNKARKLCSGVFMEGKFYVVGGVGVGSLGMLTSGEVYDLKTRTWHEIPDMYPALNSGAEDNNTPATSKAPPLLAVVKNELYAAYYARMEVLKYDKKRNSWNTIGKLPEQASSMNGWGLAFRSCGDQLIVIGGPRSYQRGFIEINSWDPDDSPPRWNLLGQKQSGSFVYNCAVMGC